MTALDHNHLVSRNCRDAYRPGPVPALLVTAVLSALILAFPDRAHSVSFEPINRSLVQSRAGLADSHLDKELKAANAHRPGSLNQHNLQRVGQDERVAAATTIVIDPYYSSTWHLRDINAPLATAATIDSSGTQPNRTITVFC